MEITPCPECGGKLELENQWGYHNGKDKPMSAILFIVCADDCGWKGKVNNGDISK